MIAAICFQITDNFVQWSAEEVTIELSEISDEFEEKELFEIALLNKSNNDFEAQLNAEKLLRWKEVSSHFRSTYIKILLPPPKLI